MCATPLISLNYYEVDELVSTLRLAIRRGEADLAVNAAVELATVMSPDVIVQFHLLPAAVYDVGAADLSMVKAVLTARDCVAAQNDRPARIAELRTIVTALASAPKSRLYSLLEDWVQLYVKDPPWQSFQTSTRVNHLIDGLFTWDGAKRDDTYLDRERFSRGLAVLANVSRTPTEFKAMSTVVTTRVLPQFPNLAPLWAAFMSARTRSQTPLAVSLWLVILLHTDPAHRPFTRVVSVVSDKDASLACAPPASSSSSSTSALLGRKLSIPDLALDLTTRRGRGFSTLSSLWCATRGEMNRWTRAEVLKSHGVGLTKPVEYASLVRVSPVAKFERELPIAELDAYAAMRMAGSVTKLVTSESPRDLAPAIRPCEVTAADMIESLSLLQPSLRSTAQTDNLRLLMDYESWFSTSEWSRGAAAPSVHMRLTPGRHWFDQITQDWFDRMKRWKPSVYTSNPTATTMTATTPAVKLSVAVASPVASTACALGNVALPTPPASEEKTSAAIKRAGDALESEHPKRARKDETPPSSSSSSTSQSNAPLPQSPKSSPSSFELLVRKGAAPMDAVDFKLTMYSESEPWFKFNPFKPMSAPALIWRSKEGALVQGFFHTHDPVAVQAVQDAAAQHAVLNGSQVSIMVCVEKPHNALALVKNTRFPPDQSLSLTPLDNLSEARIARHAKLLLQALLLRYVMSPPPPPSTLSQLALVLSPQNPSYAAVVHGGLGSRIKPPTQPNQYTGLSKLLLHSDTKPPPSPFFVMLERSLTQMSPKPKLNEMFEMEGICHTATLGLTDGRLETAAEIVAPFCSS